MFTVSEFLAMRIVNTKLEHVINCDCGARMAYDVNDFNKNAHCPRCNKPHKLNGHHDVYMLEKVTVHFPSNRLLENSNG